MTSSYAYFAFAVVMITLAMFSKENGITLLAGFVVLELLHDQLFPGPVASSTSAPSSEPTLASGVSWLFQRRLNRGAVTRFTALVAWVAVVMSYRVSVHKGAPLYKWTILENQMSLMPPVSGRQPHGCVHLACERLCSYRL